MNVFVYGFILSTILQIAVLLTWCSLLSLKTKRNIRALLLPLVHRANGVTSLCLDQILVHVDRLIQREMRERISGSNNQATSFDFEACQSVKIQNGKSAHSLIPSPTVAVLVQHDVTEINTMVANDEVTPEWWTVSISIGTSCHMDKNISLLLF